MTVSIGIPGEYVYHAVLIGLWVFWAFVVFLSQGRHNEKK